MNARVIATGKVIFVNLFSEGFDRNGNHFFRYQDVHNHDTYYEHELDFDNIDGSPNDYWTRLEHQAMIAAMQGLVTRGKVLGSSVQAVARDIAEISCEVAHALVEKAKEKEERK